MTGAHDRVRPLAQTLMEQRGRPAKLPDGIRDEAPATESYTVNQIHRH